MPFSHHSHSGQFCKHASGTLEEVVNEAIRQNFVVYGLTEHVPRYQQQDRYPEEEDLTLEDLANQFDAFVEEAHRLKNIYASRITLLVGAETEFIRPSDVSALLSLLERHKGKIEFLVGSIHHVNEIPIDLDVPTFERAKCSLIVSDVGDLGDKGLEATATASAAAAAAASEALLLRYFDAQYSLIEQVRPEVIGHADLCRLYTLNMEFSSFPRVIEKLRRNISSAIGYGALFEINPAAYRKGWDTPYPGRDVMRIILDLGGRFTLSDDSHGPKTVGYDYDRLFNYLREIEVNEIWYLGRVDYDVEVITGGRRLKPIKLEGDWWTHPFWKGRQIQQKPQGGVSMPRAAVA